LHFIGVLGKRPTITRSGIQELLAALVIVLRCAEQVICKIRAGDAAIESEISVWRACIALIDLQVAELATKFKCVQAFHPRITVGDVPCVVGLKCSQCVHAEGKVVEIYRPHGLWKSRRSRGDNAEGSCARYETEIGKVCKGALRLIGKGSGPEEVQTKLIHRAGAKRPIVTDDELLSAGCGDTGKARYAGVQSVEVVGVVEVIVERPVASLLVNEVHSLPSL